MIKYLFLILISSAILAQQIVRETLDAGNMSTKIWTTGVFNSNNINGNFAPGLEWPKGSGKTAIFTSGINVGAYVNNLLTMASASFNGELVPGYSSNGHFYTDSRFKFYVIRKGDSYLNNTSWLNWGLMVPYGAPFNDVNNNGIYEYYIDTPGVKSSAQTIFICMTDGDSTQHKIGEGFGGGTKPLYAEIHLTAWAYDNPAYEDMQFFKWEIINRHVSPWMNSYFTILSFNGIGSAGDEFVGCDTVRNLSYCYNGDNNDEGGSGSYGLNPPAVGFAFLNCNDNIRMTSYVYIHNTSTPSPACEKEPNGEPLGAYNFMRGLKKDVTPWVIPNTNPPQTTKFCYSGDPENQSGWSEFQGKINNCGGLLTGSYTAPNFIGLRYSVMSYGSEDLTVNVNDTVSITAVQLIARGSNNLNSVTLLKQLTDRAHQLCQNGFIIGINPISTEIPVKFNLYQNYPNPFNPVTKIKFDLPKSESVKLIIYDALGREISTIINEKLNAGIYSVDWDATNYPSGVYFYQLTSGSYIETKKMVLVK